MAVTILSPLNGDTVADGVRVTAGYVVANPFNLTCSVEGVPENPAQPHNPTSGVHTSTAIFIHPTSQTVCTVGADGDHSAGSDSQDNVTVTPGPAPIGPGTGTPERVYGGNGGRLVRKKYKLEGPCDPATNPAYVICRVYKVNLTTGARQIVTSAADTPKQQNGKLVWTVHVRFNVDPSANIEYVARATSYGINDNALGTTTFHIEK